ncbi:MAG TPA: ATP phosphoribosyltransferase regulatory subunit [Actinobacteria bacterium]|nr:ATP phosphoribosyltransferase regulatory subunit [Actinomycetota bacterium]
MGANNSYPSVPRGLRDIMPIEAEERRQIEKKLRRVFESWGYREIITPTFELFENLASEAGKMMEDEMFKFFDRDGVLLALRPEMTTPIARAVSQRIENSCFSRLYYSASVFREEPPQRGQQREFQQIGLELIGGRSPAADAEVLAVLLESLQAVGLKDFQVGVGQIDFLQGFLETTGISSELIKEIQLLLVKKDLVGLERTIEDNSLSPEDKSKILEIISLRGRKDILEEAKKYTTNAKSCEALKNLSDLYEFLKLFDLEKFVIFDFGIIQNFDYYTGVIFEVYAPNMGFLLGSGGRYDLLLSEFGDNRPACGFALGLERLHICLNEQGALKKENCKKILVYSDVDIKKALMTAKTLRDMDFCVETVLEPSTLDACGSLVKEGRFKWVINADEAPEQIEIFDIEKNLKKISSLSVIEGELI